MSKLLKRFIVTGGAQRQKAIWYDEFHHYRLAKVAEVDIETGAVRNLLDYETPPGMCADDRPSIVFKCASFVDNRLYLCTQTEVLVLNYPDMAVIGHYSHPCFNDLHHVLPDGDELVVVNTGLDSVVRLKASTGAIVSHKSVSETPVWERFDANVDYRKVPSTKPHQNHPNFAFFLDGRLWITRCLDKDAVCLEELDRCLKVGVERIHDGNLHGESLYFTTVNGHLCEVSAKEARLQKDHNLVDYGSGEGPLGWCRGLHVEGDTAWVGFSRIRATRMHENLRWVKKLGKPKHIGSTRIAAYDLAQQRLGREIDLEAAGFSAVFSILPVYE